MAMDGRMPTLAECDGMTDAGIIDRLTEAKGVGRWTVRISRIDKTMRPRDGRPDLGA